MVDHLAIAVLFVLPVMTNVLVSVSEVHVPQHKIIVGPFALIDIPISFNALTLAFPHELFGHISSVENTIGVIEAICKIKLKKYFKAKSSCFKIFQQQ